ncbi:MAG: transcription antitermination protein NusB [Bacillales bacterium]|nr:transcription antitermination protein NusB [Bacillales bacterium]MDY6003613.1 transcription antitermination protein NusB [Bacilli bacterium]
MEFELSRNKEQEKILGILYQALVLIDLKQELDVKQLLMDAYDCDFEDVPLFSQQILVYSLKNLDKITKAFQANMINWTFNRINKLEQALLILSYSHFYYVKDVDKKVVIDVAVKLAKKYLDSTDYKFVNAILDKTLQNA